MWWYRKIVNENSLSKTSTKSPELLAKYCDLLLKKGNKNLEDNELEEKLNQIVRTTDIYFLYNYILIERKYLFSLYFRLYYSNMWTTKIFSRNFIPRCWQEDSSMAPPCPMMLRVLWSVVWRYSFLSFLFIYNFIYHKYSFLYPSFLYPLLLLYIFYYYYYINVKCDVASMRIWIYIQTTKNVHRHDAELRNQRQIPRTPYIH